MPSPARHGSTSDGIADDAPTRASDDKGSPNADPDSNGCAPDADEDGIPDSEDACPLRAGVEQSDPKQNGCPPDSDHDGVLDVDDACPGVPGAVSKDPKDNGCPLDPDRDHDGIPNDVDACPREFGAKDPDPKRNGCPKAILRGDEIRILDQVRFDANSARIARRRRTASERPGGAVAKLRTFERRGDQEARGARAHGQPRRPESQQDALRAAGAGGREVARGARAGRGEVRGGGLWRRAADRAERDRGWTEGESAGGAARDGDEQAVSRMRTLTLRSAVLRRFFAIAVSVVVAGPAGVAHAGSGYPCGAGPQSAVDAGDDGGDDAGDDAAPPDAGTCAANEYCAFADGGAIEDGAAGTCATMACGGANGACAVNVYCASSDGGVIVDGGAGLCQLEPCVTASDCTNPAKPICDTSQNPFACVECISGADCPGVLVCDSATKTCVNPPDASAGADAAAGRRRRERWERGGRRGRGREREGMWGEGGDGGGVGAGEEGGVVRSTARGRWTKGRSGAGRGIAALESGGAGRSGRWGWWGRLVWRLG